MPAPTRTAAVTLALGLAAAGCLERHAPTTTIDETNCGGCHLADYRATTAPPHDGQFPTTCADCHVALAWVPALAGLHPDEAFLISSGAHQDTRCLECHRLDQGSSVDGANTDCLPCHTQADSAPPHVGIADYVYEPAQPHFCLSCHPRGTAGHPEDRFPIASGPHEMPCADCHRRDLGPDTVENTSCTGCHTGEHDRGRVDGQHEGVDDYVWSDINLHFCVSCHPRGRR